MSDSNIRLTRQRLIERNSDDLVESAEKIIKVLEPNSTARSKQPKLQLSQLNNFLGVARETNSVKEIEVWVQYQMGRKETKEAWNEGDFGQKILEQIGKLGKTAKQINLHDDPKLRWEVKLTHTQFVRLLAGYLVRWYVAKFEQKGGRNDR